MTSNKKELAQMISQLKEDVGSWAETEIQAWEQKHEKKQNARKYEKETGQIKENQEFRLRQLEEVIFFFLISFFKKIIKFNSIK